MKLCPKCQKQFSDDANFCPVDAARLAPLEGAAGAPGSPGSGAAADDSIAARFQLGDRLGGGRTGEVRRAADSVTGQLAALKIIAPAVVALPGLAPRLERELKQLERVQSAGVAKVLASGKRGDDTWVALELLDGAQTLAEVIAARGPITPDLAAHLIEVIGEALIEAAQVGVVHRDLAPKNILFAGDDIKLINFSLPVPPGEAPDAGKVAGVAEFVAPEQHDGKPVDQRSNLYSLGALYYFVLTGQAVQHDEAGAVKPPSTLATVPGGVEAIIVRALDRSPTKRFLTVRQFVDEVGRVARGETDPKAAPAGRAKPKAELVQTLLGIRGLGGQLPNPPVLPGSAAALAKPTAIPSGTPTVQGIAAISAPVASLPGAATVVSGPPEMPAPLPVDAAPQGLSPDRSPWAPPVTIGPEPGVPSMAPLAEPASSAIATLPETASPVGSSPGPSVAAATPAAHGMAPLTLPPSMASQAPAASPAVAPAAAPAAPVVPAPLLASQGGKKSGDKAEKADKAEKGDKGRFRETMWFKKGELDAEAAEVAAREHAKTGKDGSVGKNDLLPIDERYKDDGSLSRSDKEKYSLRTGGTVSTNVVRESGAIAKVGKVSEDDLINEMRGGRNKIIALVAAGVVVLILLIVLVAR